MSDKNIYKSYSKIYHQNGYSCIPDKYMSKQPAIKDWSKYSNQLPTFEELTSWNNNFSESNIAVLLGEASGIVALDLDATDQRVLDIVMPILPESPVTKIGAKGETRFFRYTGETTDILKFNGEVVIELLSTFKKTTLPPSVHPSGVNYTWKDKSLLEVEKKDLPMIPPALFSHIASKLKLAMPDVVEGSYGKVISGRNDALSSLCGTLISEGKSLDEAIRELIEFDKKTNEVPLFSDPNEMRHTDAITNALMFYSNHLSTINTRRYRENKEYEVPAIQTVADIAKIEELRLGKQVRQEEQRNLSNVLQHAPSVIKTIHSNILDNSWIKQPELALGATLALMAVLCSRKVVFQGMSPNLYILNIATSGSGKDAPQQMIKNILIDLRAEQLLGAGDYVSDASLMDSLDYKPTRLDIMDEAGGILKTVNSGKSDYSGKMADILAELYTTSNNKYLGRATAEGNKGTCYRPNVNILASTTPTGLSEGISIKAIEKGLMGRFLIFLGDNTRPATRLTSFPKLDDKTKQHLLYWFSFNPSEEQNIIGGIPQQYVELTCTDEASKRLDELFTEFDLLRTTTNHNDPMLPIISRLYQQMIKLIIISACARTAYDVPVIIQNDVEFGYELIKYYMISVKQVVSRYIFNNNTEREAVKVINVIRDNGNKITKSDLYRQTRELKKRERDTILDDLMEGGTIIRDVETVDGKKTTVFYLVKEN